MMMADDPRRPCALGVGHDVFFSERSLIEGETAQAADSQDQVAATIEALRARGEVYEGRLPPPKGGDLPRTGKTASRRLFRSTDFGDDVDRPLKKSDGSYTYFASDIAYHKSKFDRGFRNMIDVWGADHGGYVKRMQAAVKAVSGGKADARRQDRPAGAAAARRRAGENVEARRRVRHLARSGR